MCVRIQPAASPSPAYDHKRCIIRVPAGLPPALTLRCVRAVLAELHAPQPDEGARCWCGEPVTLDHVPAQRTGEVISSGA
jgi:hypothetical protein